MQELYFAWICLILIVRIWTKPLVFKSEYNGLKFCNKSRMKFKMEGFKEAWVKWMQNWDTYVFSFRENYVSPLH